MSDARFHFEVIVVGGGPAGIAAACAAAEGGAAVALVDEAPSLGGQIWRAQQSHRATAEACRWFERFEKSGAMLLSGTSVIAAPEPGLLLAEHNLRPCQLHWQRLILATGARELFLPYPGWTLPGNFGPGGLLGLAKQGWPVAGRRIVIAGSGPLLLAAAAGLRKDGAHIVAIAEQAPASQVMSFASALFAHRKLGQAVRLKLNLLGVPYRLGTWITQAEGDHEIRSVTLTNGRRTWRLDCDFLACGFGLVPNVELPLALGCGLANDFVQVDPWQATTVPNVYCAGEPTSIAGFESALIQGQIAGHAATGRVRKAEELFAKREASRRFVRALARAFALRPELKSLANDDTVLCRCEDVKLGKVRQFSGWRDAKLQSRCGMGACQGRICGAAAKFLFGWGWESVRPPVIPALVGSLISEPATNPAKGDLARVGKSELASAPLREKTPVLPA